ncbi:MAG: transcriptional repressor [Defluviitaleaceae bacterium]|nr:transcriptional repressor [Defluviitaleaceae bacterium]
MSLKRNTIQRQIILDTLKRFNTHPSVDVLYTVIHKSHPTISKATVYRNLRQLAGEGIITQMAVSDDVARYDGTSEPHYHFSCKVCNKIFDLDMDCVEGIDDQIRSKYGYKVDKHEILFVGTCQDCE